MHLPIGRSVRIVCLGILFTFVFVVALTFYLCSGRSCGFELLNSTPHHWRRLRANRQNSFVTPAAKSDFDIRGSDVIVFLHVQNTGGSVFARNVVEDLDLQRPCTCKRRKSCRCSRPDGTGAWFFSRYTAGWKCGVHPDWTQLTGCVDRAMDEEEGRPVKRRYFFVTVLRDPVKRFLSEFWHVRRGQGWPNTCFEDKRDVLANLTLEEFSKCPQNPAINRQTRMLSDLPLVGSHNSSSDDHNLILLTSARNNLRKMSFFGLSEYPRVSRYVFEATFGLHFRSRASVVARKRRKKKDQLFREMAAQQMEVVRRLNGLDEELYSYARELLFVRFKRLRTEEDPVLFEDTSNEEEDWADREDIMMD